MNKKERIEFTRKLIEAIATGSRIRTVTVLNMTFAPEGEEEEEEGEEGEEFAGCDFKKFDDV